MTEFGKRISNKDLHDDNQAFGGDTIFGDLKSSVGDRVLAAESPESRKDYPPSPTEQRLASMVQALLELEARNQELARAIQQKDYATMDRHIEYHSKNGNFSDSMARQTMLEVDKQLKSSSQMMEWHIS